MTKNIVNKELKELYKRIRHHKTAYIFLQPVSEIIAQWPLYKEVIKEPMDLLMIESKLNQNEYNNSEEFKADVDLMLQNCFTFNHDPNHFCHKAGLILKDFFNNNFKKVEYKISRQLQKYNEYQKKIQGYEAKENYSKQSNKQISAVQIISNNEEEEKIINRLKSQFMKISDDLNVGEEHINELVSSIARCIIKRSKSLELLYDSTLKFLNSNLKTLDNKATFLKKFRKLLKSIKDEQGEEENKLNIKINLNEDEVIKENKIILEDARRIVANFIDYQKVPEEFREYGEYPLEPEVKKNIRDYVSDVRSKMYKTYTYIK